MGVLLERYYQIYQRKDFENSLVYSFGFEGYINNLFGIHENMVLDNVSKTMFYNTQSSDDDGDEDNEDEDEGDENSVNKSIHSSTDSSCRLQVTDQYYPTHILFGDKCVKNSINISKSIIITGVNASGKTTFLKTCTLNILFSQQFGIGFYKSCTLRPYTHIHSYLNIPDTSGRDSLFQAEARRCKDIIDIINNSDETSHHFCIFDELYSGTNAVDATKSAYAFLKYLILRENVTFILTTHYNELCSKLKLDRIDNYKMQVIENNDTYQYTYKIKPGICDIQGAIEVLKNMNYPSEIIKYISNYDNSENKE
jgi:DNA mismatch repair ATPase MutS